MTWRKQNCFIHPHGRGEQASAGAYQRAHGTNQASAPNRWHRATERGVGEVYISACKESARRMHTSASGSSDEGCVGSSRYDVHRMGVSAEGGGKGKEEKKKTNKTRY